ncbi:NAD-dependent epimerase/dehydratase family protein [Chondromyces crocatus]|uniref:UDP-glucose 4-epimerase n=1 Tax=Chondromyces crocatus TaxID=52 RepID=A0A0K1E8E0_CHOCO|nr:NAD-dependent epimerase/dehydratase family protein [Chondromyces crocatus]AKT37120.1 UDP-glucose 4-epimerase [Chondromyces crocatus]
MRCLVTGAAGFVGSHLSERLVALGHDVVGVDRFSAYYPLSHKEANLARLRDEPRFRLEAVDLCEADLVRLLDGCEVVFHVAAQAGVRSSWEGFDVYLRDNVLATQRLLEAARRPGSTVRKVVYASSSSVYGDAPELPFRESSPTVPCSPYGVTKLSAEQLCELYRRSFGLATASLRYFTVYGPRQRPDMGFFRFIEATLSRRSIPLFGDGEQTRDFTFVADIVEATRRAGEGGAVGIYNVGGGSRVTLNQVLSLLGEIAGEVRVERRPSQAGEMAHTWADISAAARDLGYAPAVTLREGLEAQVAWHRSRRSDAA